MTDRYYSNRELTLKVIPSPDADFAEAIYPFAMTYKGYDVWGDKDAAGTSAGATGLVQSDTRGCPRR